MRKPIVAGQFYPRGKEELISSIEESFESEFGPGRLPAKREPKKLYGAITPHAGYRFSGAGAARVFKEVGESAFPRVYVMIGVNHSGPETCVSDEDWETPLGVVKRDKELVKALAKKGMTIDNEAHHGEHSIEVQLPFLQYISKDHEEELRIVYVMIADDDYERWGKMILDAVEESVKEAVFICSSDFTHYGDNYGYTPFVGDVKQNMEKLDKAAADFIVKKDPAGFLAYTNKTRATICGKYGIAVLLWIMSQIRKPRGKSIGYYTSGDVLGNYENAVGYASITFS
ncbi:TPA: AmmeMemoRadiSam system protein B [Candidatus Woesearchaeota archaeon]|nr:AmmeMemoRadiSam system protein B [Candidatus Woesearchaeota archaeon]